MESNEKEGKSWWNHKVVNIYDECKMSIADGTFLWAVLNELFDNENFFG